MEGGEGEACGLQNSKSLRTSYVNASNAFLHLSQAPNAPWGSLPVRGGGLRQEVQDAERRRAAPVDGRARRGALPDHRVIAAGQGMDGP